MEKSIEMIWKEGFLNSNALVAPKINDLYNQRSNHLIDKMKRMFKNNLIGIVVMAIVLFIMYFALGAIWQGVTFFVLLIGLAWYSKHQMQKIKEIDHGQNSYDYLKAFYGWLNNELSRNVRFMRFFYPLCFLIAMSTIWSAWNKSDKLMNRMVESFPDSVFIGGIPLFVLATVAAATILIFLFSGEIYKWDVRMIYGRVFDKLENTIREMESLKREQE